MIYKGHLIERTWPRGYYVTFVLNAGRLMADTLAGIKQLITETINRERRE